MYRVGLVALEGKKSVTRIQICIESTQWILL
jgi:hypothetical protein